MIMQLLTKFAGPKVLAGLVVTLAVTSGLLGLQTLRLAWCENDIIDLEHRLATARQGRDTAVATAEANHGEVLVVRDRLAACVASKAADVRAAQEAAREAIAARAAREEALQDELNKLRRIYESDEGARLWRDTPIPPAVADWLRDDAGANRDDEDRDR